MATENDAIKTKIEQKQEELKTKIEALKSKAEQEIDDLEEPDTGGTFGAVTNVSIDVKWRMTSIKFDIPKFSMERETIKFDVPQVKMELEKISFDVPAVKMVTKCAFKIPEFHGLKIYSKCVYMDVPETYSKRIEFKTDIPKFTSKRVEIKFDKPVVRMETIEIKLHLPQFFVKSVDVEINEYSEKAQQISNELSADVNELTSKFKTEMDAELKEEVKSLFEGMRKDLVDSRKLVCSNYENAISQTKTSIKRLKEANAVERVKELEQKLAGIIADFDKSLKEIDSNLEELAKQETEAFMNLKMSA
ncbi:hypothetical protein K6119_15265 [Paracrocinitomix mangrovi]|uniref:hypothetical protein n=1 Tax=Paracrocinitomix mangrovi TaxID=2862509 RepID=UPI001C8E6015|nr:hypothetical protein [Paracrocinitomix mangrovi]UKN01089.1 hypothetical protein K6119_15265 [Paracrocinitomix mangrovi]